MTAAELTTGLAAAGGKEVRFLLPDGGLVPAHAHITEVGRVDREFLDCGGEMRKTSFCCLQAWVADDEDHRLPAAKLASIIRRALEPLRVSGLPVEIEYEDGYVSQFPVVSLETGDAVLIRLGTKHTDCLAKDVCLPPAAAGDGCCAPGSGCC